MKITATGVQQKLGILAASVSLLVIAGCATSPQSGQIVEWAEFKVRPEVSEGTLLQASDSLHEDFLRKQKGFIRRDLLKGKDGQWVDVVYWQDQASADEAMKQVEHSPACAAYFQYMLDPEAGVLHFDRVRTYSR